MVLPLVKKMMTKMIKVNADTMLLLQDLKIVERESYDEVINRLIQYFAENQLSLNKQTRAILATRLKNLKEGKTLSFNQILDLMHKNEKERTSKGGKKSAKRAKEDFSRGDDDVLGD